LREVAGVELPQAYLDFLAYSDGGEGPLPNYPTLVLDDAQSVASHRVDAYYSEFYPNLFVIGGDGGGDYVAFDMRGAPPWPVVAFDAIGGEVDSADVLAGDFSALLNVLGIEPVEDGLTCRSLDATNWPAFAALVKRHNGVWDDRWRLALYPAAGQDRSSAQYLADVESRVRQGTVHAVLVFDGKTCVGWCQFGTPEELPCSESQRCYNAGLTKLPDWRITCFFTDKDCDGHRVVAAALEYALLLITCRGGGEVEGYPQEIVECQEPSSLPYNASLALFEAQGFTRTRPLGHGHWVVTKRVPPILRALSPVKAPGR
jgi:hypothetical protein